MSGPVLCIWTQSPYHRSGFGIVLNRQSKHGIAGKSIIFEGRLPPNLKTGLFVGHGTLGPTERHWFKPSPATPCDPGRLGVNLVGASLGLIAIALFFWGATQLTEFFYYAALGCFLSQFVKVYFVGSMGGGKSWPLKTDLGRRGDCAVFGRIKFRSSHCFILSHFDQVPLLVRCS